MSPRATKALNPGWGDGPWRHTAIAPMIVDGYRSYCQSSGGLDGRQSPWRHPRSLLLFAYHRGRVNLLPFTRAPRTTSTCPLTPIVGPHRQRASPAADYIAMPVFAGFRRQRSVNSLYMPCGDETQHSPIDVHHDTGSLSSPSQWHDPQPIEGPRSPSPI